jgi:hypothetical protein
VAKIAERVLKSHADLVALDRLSCNRAIGPPPETGRCAVVAIAALRSG